METTPRKKEERKKNPKRFPLASIFLFISLGVGFHLISSGKICFSYQDHICLGVFFFLRSNNKIVISSASDDVSQMYGFLEVSFYLLENQKKSQRRWKAISRRWQRRQLELLKVNIFLGTRATLEIEIKQPFYF